MITKEMHITLGIDMRPEYEDHIARYERNIAAEQHALDLLAIDAANIDNMRATVTSLADHVTLGIASHNQPGTLYNDILSAMRRNAVDWRNWASNVDTTLQSQRIRFTRNIEHYESRLNETRMALARTRPPRVVTLHAGDFKKELTRSVGAKNIRLSEKSGHPVLEAVFDNIVLTPIITQKMPFWIKTLNGAAPCVRIPPVKVLVYPVSRCIELKCVRTRTGLDAAGYISGFTGTYVAHPHVTSRSGQPCLGDWGGPLMEALEAADYTLAFDIIKQFLRSASDDDPAGRNWRRYIDSDAHRNWNSSQPPLASYTLGGKRQYAYFLLDGKGGVTKLLHDDPNNWPNLQVVDLAPPPATVITELPDDSSVAEAADDELELPTDPDVGPDGYDADGIDADGFDRDGLDADGYDRDGFDRDGNNRFAQHEYIEAVA